MQHAYIKLIFNFSNFKVQKGHERSNHSHERSYAQGLLLAFIWYTTCLYSSDFQFFKFLGSVNWGKKLGPMILGQTRSWTLKQCQNRKIMAKIGGVEHWGRPSKLKTVASTPHPPGIKSAIWNSPFSFLLCRPFKGPYGYSQVQKHL